MTSATDPSSGGLARLTIEERQRPTVSVRTWVVLIGLIGCAALIAVLSAWWYYHTTGRNIVSALREKPAEVTLLTLPAAGRAGPAAQQVVLVANGRIVSDQRVNVATKVSGQIVELTVEQGDRVEAGQVLARIEDVIFRAQRDEAAANVDRYRHALVRARAELARAEARVEEARAEYDFAKFNHERLQRLAATRETSDVEVVDARNRYESTAAALQVARAEAESARATVEVTAAELQGARAVLRLTQKRLDDCAIRAPISGVVLERNAEVGDFLAAEGGRGANANAQLVSIADMTRLRVEVDLSERDVHRVQQGQPARVTPDADRSRAYQGQVLWIDPMGDYAKATVQAKVRVFDPGPELRIDGSAKVEFLTPAGGATASNENAAAVWLPKSAVKLTPGSNEAEVFTVEAGRAVAHRVTIGARTDKSVELVSGLSPGMKLIAEHLDIVSGGSPVKPTRTVSLDDF